MGQFDSNTVGQFILYMVALIFSLSVHESAHAWMSSRFGDDLARSQGRISLNPAAHVDPELELRAATGRFRARVEGAERLAAGEGRVWAELPVGEQDAYFDRAKETV